MAIYNIYRRLYNMSSLNSPGVSISVIDQSITLGSTPGTVPLIIIATQQNKIDPTSGTAIAVGTTPATAGTVYSITSQRDLVSTFGDPVFYNVSGTPINGYPLNEYGLLAAYSFLGISNLCQVVRANIDLAALEATPVAPTSPAAANTYWFDESSAGSSYGLFVQTGTSPSSSAAWVAVTPNFVYDFWTGTTNAPVSTDGVNGNYAVVFQTANGTLTYWVKTSGSWVQLGTTVGTQMLVQSVWPDLSTTLVTQQYWIKTTSVAQGANIVLRTMSATSSSFVQVEAPILANDAAADTYYSTNATGSASQVYVEPVISGTGATAANALEFRYSTGVSSSWTPFEYIVGSTTVPTSGPLNGQLWFNALVGLNSNAQSTVDIMIADGVGAWQNINLPGFSTLSVHTNSPTLYPQSQDPRDNIPAVTLHTGDIWVQTAGSPYPLIYRWSSSAWHLVNNEDQTTPNGIIFSDARPNPLYHTGSYAGQNNEGGTNPDLDPDAPQAALYPKGFLLWNTRYSSNNVKSWQSPYVYNGVTVSADNTNSGSTGRWINVSGNNPGGVPYMGAAAQHQVVVTAMKSMIDTNEAILAEDLYFNLIASPGYLETMSDMLTLNDSRGDTAFVVGDAPFKLNSTGTSLQSWATNSNLAFDNGITGLVSSSKYLGVWYPSGLSTNTDGTSVVVPSSHIALSTIAYSDQVSYPWFAPAGLQRGVVNNATSVGYVDSNGLFNPVMLSQGQRDILYANGVNPIRTMPSGGVVVYGQKTRQSYASATDRINVVRLENYLRYQMNQLVQPFLFEPNDSTTRNAVLAAFNSFLSELITLRGLYDYIVVCDTSNNTPSTIDAGQLWIDVAIQPVKAIEFIYIPIRIVNTGASLLSSTTA